MGKRKEASTGTTLVPGATPRRKRAAGWTKAVRDEFLTMLAATCNVKASATKAGVTHDSLYKIRNRDPAFRAEWADALEAGYQMLETQMIGHALAGGGPFITNGDTDRTGPIDLELAKWLLATRQARLGGSRRQGNDYKRVTPEETNAAILKKLKAMSLTLGTSS